MMGLVESEWMETLTTIEMDQIIFRDYVEVPTHNNPSLTQTLGIALTLTMTLNLILTGSPRNHGQVEGRRAADRPRGGTHACKDRCFQWSCLAIHISRNTLVTDVKCTAAWLGLSRDRVLFRPCF